MGYIDKPEETRRWEIRKMKTAGIEIREMYSDEEEEKDPELVYVDHLPTFLSDRECSTILKNDIIIERPNTEIGIVAKSRSTFLSTHPRSDATAIIGGCVKEVATNILPIHKFRDDLMRFIERHQVVVLIGETGCGKSTQMPQYLYQDGYGEKGIIGCTQPRRVAATSLSNTLKGVLGGIVAHSVRFDDTTTSETIIKYMTEGILLQELLSDSILSKYSVLILDEAHERSTNLDVSIGLLKPILEKRKELKLIIMSATIQTEKFCKFFECPAFRIEGKSYPVSIEYLNVNVDDYVEWAVKRIIHIHNNCEEGDILVFATGKEDVDGIAGIVRYIVERDLNDESIGQALSAATENSEINGKDEETNMVNLSRLDLKVLPLYSQLPMEKQEEVFKEERGIRRCIVSTNIAETSLTIPNIRYVIDCGLQKTNVYNYNLGESLVTTPISKASADQRAGRAGRTRPGICYRMYTKETYENELLSSSVPEIQRVNVCNIVLLLLRQNVNDILSFGFIDSPSPKLIKSALFLLYRLDAIDSKGFLTSTGKILSELKLDPPLAKMVLNSIRYGCIDDMLSICSSLSVEEIFYKDFDRMSPICYPNCDFLTLLNIFNEFVRQNNRNEWCNNMRLSSRALEKALEIKRALGIVLTRRGIEISRSKSPEVVQRCILSSLYYNIAKRRNKGYVCLSNFAVCKIHPSSVIKEDTSGHVIFYRYMITKTEYIYCCSSVDPRAILLEAGKYYRDRGSCEATLDPETSYIKKHGAMNVKEMEKIDGCAMGLTNKPKEAEGQDGAQDRGIGRREVCISKGFGSARSNSSLGKIRGFGDLYNLEKESPKSISSVAFKIDPSESLYDRFEKWEDSNESEDIEPTKKSRRARL